MKRPTALLAFLATLTLGKAGLASADEKSMLIATADLARENIRKFSHGSIKFSFQDGFAANQDDARSGHLDQLATAQGQYRYDGEGRAFFDLRYPAETLAALWRKTPTGTGSRANSFQSVTNGSISVLEHLDVHGPANETLFGSISVSVGAEEFYSRVRMPLGLGFPAQRPDYDQHLRWAASGDNGFRLVSWDAKSVLEGQTFAYFHLRSTTMDEELWLDLEKGAIPVLAKIHAPEVVIDEFREKIESIPGRGWLPLMHTIHVDRDRWTQRMVIDSYNFDAKPSPDAFAITFLKPEPLLHPVTSVELPPAKRWNLDRLPASFTASRSVAAGGRGTFDGRGEVGSDAVNAPARQPAPEPLPGELATPPTSPWLVGSIVAVIVAALGGSFGLWRHRRRA